jgi:hypothetical protein
MCGDWDKEEKPARESEEEAKVRAHAAANGWADPSIWWNRDEADKAIPGYIQDGFSILKRADKSRGPNGGLAAAIGLLGVTVDYLNSVYGAEELVGYINQAIRYAECRQKHRDGVECEQAEETKQAA